jgi:gas vesicle protein
MNSSFAQVLHSFSVEKQESSKASTSIDQTASKFSLRGVGDMGGDLASAISQAGKENKGQIAKLGDRIKQLERDVEMLKGEL